MQKVSTELCRGSELFATVEVPYASLSEFNDFLEELRCREPDRSFLAVIDEFDELPNAAFERGGPGDALFRGFKAFSSDGDCGFILVGGERLDLALAQQSDRLNGFVDKRVGYLDEDEFAALVENPVKGILAFDADALSLLWTLTAGHPWNTLIICREILSRAKLTRDNHVTSQEIHQAYAAAVRATSRDPFSHMWYDGAFADGAELIVIANRRVKALLAWAQCLCSDGVATEDAMVAFGAESFDLKAHDLRDELRAFLRRGILRLEGDGYEAQSRFFVSPDRDAGIERLTAGDPKLAEVRRFEDREDEQRVRPAEIVALSDR